MMEYASWVELENVTSVERISGPDPHVLVTWVSEIDGYPRFLATSQPLRACGLSIYC